MTLQVSLWIVLAMGLTALVIGLVEWFKGRSRLLALAAAANVAMVLIPLLGDSHPLWRYACFAIVAGFVAYTFMTLRRTIRWRSFHVLCGAASLLFLLVAGFVPGIPAEIQTVLMFAYVASTALFVGSMLWVFSRAFVRYRESRAGTGSATLP